MRAVYLSNLVLEDLSFPSLLELGGDEAFHLVKVVRVKKAEKILLLNGLGLCVWGEVDSFVDHKKVSVVLKLLSFEQRPPFYTIDLFFGIPKKEALEDVLRLSGELGYRQLIPLTSDYASPWKLNEERVSCFFAQGLEQSNNPWCPTLLPPTSLSQELFLGYDALLFYTSETFPQQTPLKLVPEMRIGVIIGPEGGWSPSELAFFAGRPFFSPVRWKSPIFRTTTAICVAMGGMLSHFEGP